MGAGACCAQLAERVGCAYGRVLGTACGAGGLQVRSRAAHGCGAKGRVARAGVLGCGDWTAWRPPAAAWRPQDGAIGVDLNKIYGAAAGGWGPTTTGYVGQGRGLNKPRKADRRCLGSGEPRPWPFGPHLAGYQIQDYTHTHPSTLECIDRNCPSAAMKLLRRCRAAGASHISYTC